MSKLSVYLFCFIVGNAFAQNYIVFENNKKNKALFDYNDPNSLVSMLVQNRDKIISSMGDYGNTKINEYSLHPIEGMPSISVLGQKWELDGKNGVIDHLKTDDIDQSFSFA